MKIIKRCEHCNTEFESEHHWNKRFCCHVCYKRAKVVRRIARDHGKAPVVIVDTRYVSTLHYPTRERLMHEANQLKVGEQSKIVGMNHMWDEADRPSDIKFVKSPELENGTEVWTMFKFEAMPDLVKQLLGNI